MRPGYKQTEIGVIPEDWEATPFVMLGSVIDGDRGANYPGSRDFASDGHCLFLNAGNVTKAGFRFNECAFISLEKDMRLSKGKLKRDDIVLTTRGTVGNFAYFDSSVPFEHIRINSGMVILRKNSDTLDTKYLYALLHSHLVEQQIERFTFGSAQPQLTVKGISKFAIAVPPLTEQRAIAAALSDLDALLDGLERLIAKKRDLKQAAMQQLLTGQTRLSGFTEEWICCKVQDVITDYFCGPSPTCEERNIADDLEWGVLKTTAAKAESGWNWKAHKVLPRTFWNQPKLELRHGDVIVTKAGPRHRVGVSAWVDFVPPRIIVSGKMIGLRPQPGTVVPLMLVAAISARETQLYLDQRTTGMAESQVNFENTALLEAPIRIPKFAEQTAIANILSDMDAEIAALETRRDKPAPSNRA